MAGTFKFAISSHHPEDEYCPAFPFLPPSYGATAIKYGATLVTGDPDFKKVEHLIEIDWLT